MYKRKYALNREVIPNVKEFPPENSHALSSLPVNLLTLNLLIASASDMLLFRGGRGILCRHAHRLVRNIGLFHAGDLLLGAGQELGGHHHILPFDEVPQGAVQIMIRDSGWLIRCLYVFSYILLFTSFRIHSGFSY